MIPLKQQNLHKPDEGIFGDCHRAAIASVLELPIDAVPHFGDGNPESDEFHARVDRFMTPRGLRMVSIPFAADLDQTMAAAVNFAGPDIFHLLGGTSRTGCHHTVVCQGGKIVHDPSLIDAGIVAPTKDGHYWIDFFVALRPENIAALAA